MRRIDSLYLAGPDLWFPHPLTLYQRKRDLCAAAGFRAVTPMDGELVETEPSEVMAREIYANNIARIRQCDAMIANLTPWRGPGCDPGTAFEVGFAAALGKPVFAYMNVVDADEADHLGRVGVMLGAQQDMNGRWLDGLGLEIEDFGLAENLMLWAESRCLFVEVTDDPFSDLGGMARALDTARVYAAA